MQVFVNRGQACFPPTLCLTVPRAQIAQSSRLPQFGIFLGVPWTFIALTVFEDCGPVLAEYPLTGVWCFLPIRPQLCIFAPEHGGGADGSI